VETGGPIAPDAFRTRASARLHAWPVPPDPREGRSDFDLTPDLRAELATPRPVPAAVLVPVVAHGDGATLLLTQRAAHLRKHSGQIAFPGGRIDEDDADALHAALREAEEEIGLSRGLVAPVGYLDPYLTSTGFGITPVVAIVDPGYSLSINRDEVDDAFEAPLDFLMNPTNHQEHQREWQGRLRRYYAMPWQERYIWGVTAGIIRNLFDRVYGR
jgi:8-oxo-dGTP pyrophosphatase MutT (NUDIX family)